MGLPTPNVLFSQSFRHFHPGEHVDEVRFSEPVVITACEILEQHSNSLCKSISLAGVSSPQSFSVEIFVRSGGDARFKRFCHAFLYSASAPPLQDLQVALTDHVVLRGTYHSLTLVLYGNHASKIGPSLGDHDLDSAVPDLLPKEASCSLEDLPEKLRPSRYKFGVRFSPLQHLQLVHIDKENSCAIRRLLQVAGQIECLSKDANSLHKIVNSLVSASSYIQFSESRSSTPYSDSLSVSFKPTTLESSGLLRGLNILEIEKELQDFQAQLEEKMEEITGADGRTLQDINETAQERHFKKSDTSELVLSLVLRWIQGPSQSTDFQIRALLPVEEMLGGLAAAQLLCTDVEECYRFVLAGGVHILVDLLQHEVCNLSAMTLLALGVVECISQYAFGCEALLGWWSPDASPSEEKGELRRFNSGYTILLKFLLQPQQRPVYQVAARVLYRLRAYELTAAFQEVVQVLVDGLGSNVTDSLGEERLEGKPIVRATLLIKQLLGLLKIRENSGNEDFLSKFSHYLAMDGEDAGSLLRPCVAYGATTSTQMMNGRQDMDPYLLSVLGERRLLPMLVTLVAAPRLRSLKVEDRNACVELVAVIEDLLLALLSCRSGLLFLAQDIEVSSSLLACFRRVQDLHEKNLAPIRHTVALSKAGFLCHPQDIGGILQTYFSVLSAMDRLLGAKGQEDFLWALWELSTISRVESGRQALPMLTWFPEVMKLLVGALQPGPDSPPGFVFGETLYRTAVHFVANVLQVVISDDAAPTVAAWTPHAVSLQRALLAAIVQFDGSVESTVGYEEKDGACFGLLEWLDSAVVYHKKGAIGLLKYASGIIAGCGGISQNNVGHSPIDNMDSDTNVGDQAVSNDTANMGGPYQGKWAVMEASTSQLTDMSTVQLTVAFRILALVSCYPGVTASLYGEGAMAVVYTILELCLAFLQSSSSAYDTSIDEDDVEFERPVEDLADHGKEHLLLGLLMPTVLFLLSLLQNVQAAVLSYQNTRLLDVLLPLHQQMSSRIASYASVPPFTWSGMAQEFIAVRHVLTSVLVCWPIFGWTPALIPRLLGLDTSSTMQSGLPMEPIETCSVLSLLADMLPRENPQLCNNKSALLDIYRSLATDSVLGTQTASVVSWHTQPPYSDQLVQALVLHLDQISEIISHHTSTACVVLQDMLKLFIVRLACSDINHCASIVRHITSQIREQRIVGSDGSEKETLYVEHAVQMVAGLASHPATKVVLLREGVIEVLLTTFTAQYQSYSGDAASSQSNGVIPVIGCWVWIVRAFVALCDPDICCTGPPDRLKGEDSPSFGDCCSIFSCLLNIFKVIPVGKELEIVLEGFEILSSYKHMRAAFAHISLQNQEASCIGEEETNESGKSVVINGTEGRDDDQTPVKTQTPIYLDLWERIRSALESEQGSGLVITNIIQHFATSVLLISLAGKSIVGVAALDSLFGLGSGSPTEDILKQEKLEPIEKIATILGQYIIEDGLVRLSSGEMSSLGSVPVRTIQETYTALMAMLRIIKRPEIGKKMTERAFLVAKSISAAGGSLRRLKLRSHKSGVAALLSSIELDLDFENVFGSSIDSQLQLEKDAEIGVMDTRGKLVWECSAVEQEKPGLVRTSTKRKPLAIIEVSRKRHSMESSAATIPLPDGTPNNGISFVPISGRALPASVTQVSALNRRDTFRQRKPNTSRPPSMHVDDYVARERSEVITSGNSPATLQRATSGSGRPPSIHVDEFMAKQQERQHQSVGNSGIDDLLPVMSRNLSLPSVDLVRKDTTGLSLDIPKVGEDEGQFLTSSGDKEYEKQWEEILVSENVIVGPSFSHDSPSSLSGPSLATDLRSEKTSCSSSSISNTTDSVLSVKTPQVADMLLLQSKVTLQTSVARNLSGVVHSQQEDVLKTTSSSGVQQQEQHLRDGTKISHSSGQYVLDKKLSDSFHTRTSELKLNSRSSAPVTSSIGQSAESHSVLGSQGVMNHSLSVFSLPGTIDSKNANPPGSEQGGSLRKSSAIPSDTQSSSIPLLPTREGLASKRGMNPQGILNSATSGRGKGQLSNTSGLPGIQPSESSTPIVQTFYDSHGIGLRQGSPFSMIPHHTSHVQMALPKPLREENSLQSTTSNGPTKGMISSSIATDPRPRPPDMRVERTAGDVPRPVPPPLPTTPWPADTSQSRLESAATLPLASLLSAQASSYNLVGAAGIPGPQWPSREMLPTKGISLARSLESPLPSHSHSARYPDESGALYSGPGRVTQLPGNPPLPVGHNLPFAGSMQFSATFVSGQSGSSAQGTNLETSGIIQRDRVVSGQVQNYNGASTLQPNSYVPPPVPAGKPNAPHAPLSTVNIPAQQQLHLHFQQQNILKAQQQQLQSQQQQWHQPAQLPKLQQHHQQQLLGPLPMSVQVPIPIQPPPAAQSLQRSQQHESSAILQQMLASPDAIQALLKDQNKLRELLEQHPKLISLLQEKMSQAPP